MRASPRVARWLLVAALACGSQGVEPVGAEAVFEFRPGVIVDSGRGDVYVMHPGGGIDAVDLASGERIWRTKRAAKPLARHGDLLAAQVEPRGEEARLRIALLDNRAIRSEPQIVEVPLPDGVWPGIDDRLESSFDVSARAADGSFVLRWRYVFRRATGPPPGPGEEAREAAGRVRIDVATGRVTTLDPAKAEEERPERVWRVDGVLVELERTMRAGSQRVVLKRRDAATGAPLPDVTLFEEGLGFRSVSADRRHLLASRREPGGWEWVVFSLETGARVAALPHDMAGARFFVAGSGLVHETEVLLRREGGRVVAEPGRLRAVDLGTGSEVWSHAIRDTRYRGPQPPGGPQGTQPRVGQRSGLSRSDKGSLTTTRADPASEDRRREIQAERSARTVAAER